MQRVRGLMEKCVALSAPDALEPDVFEDRAP